MGNFVSFYLTKFSKRPNETTGLTHREVRLVQKTWKIIAKYPGTASVEFFVGLFTRHPQYQKYFSFRDVPVSKLKHDKRLKAHAYGAFLALQEIVENLENTEKLIDLLSSLGEDHSKRNIPKQAFWDLKAMFLDYLKEKLGIILYKISHNAWNKALDAAFTVIVSHLQ